MELHLGYYATEPVQRKQWIKKGIDHIRNSDSTLAENFSGNFLWLIQSFEWDKRMDEWKAVDSVYRLTINKGKDSRQHYHAILNHGNIALAEKKYQLVSNLAKYEQVYLKHFPANDTQYKVNKIYADWLQFVQLFEQWKLLSYGVQTGNTYQMNEGQEIPVYLQRGMSDSFLISYDYNAKFTNLIDETRALKKEFLDNNHRGDKAYNERLRKNYFYLSNKILLGYFSWAILSQNEMKPLLSLKMFLWEDVKDEMTDAKKNNTRPVIDVNDLIASYKALSVLYYNMGNFGQSINILNHGLEEVLNNPGFTRDEKLNLISLHSAYASSYRAMGNFEKALEENKKILSLTAKPHTEVTYENTVAFDRYYNLKLEDVFTLMAMGKRQEGIDSTLKIMEEITPLFTKNETLLYTTTTWVKLQFLTATISGYKGKWDEELIKEMLGDIMFNKNYYDILYPGHLLMLKATWVNNKKTNEGYLSNLLSYTSKQLYKNFVVLTAQERMQFFSNVLQQYFDIYHELLFSGALEEYPLLKKEVLNQSMFLKNSLADGNIIPDSLFSEYAKKNPGFLENLRRLRQEVILSTEKRKLYDQEINAGLINDRMQLLWLDALNNAKLDNSVNSYIPKQIDSLLNKEAVYIETIRYKQWLTDSTYMYGAYIIEKGKPIKIIPICEEKKLLEILNNPAASPQNEAVAGDSRGIELLGKKDNNKRIYKPGDKDQLAALLLTPLSAYINKKEWILVNDGLLNRIAFSALVYDNKYLTEQVTLKQLSSSNQLDRKNIMPKNKSALLTGDISYGFSDPKNKNAVMQSSLQWKHLPATKKEIDQLQNKLQTGGFKTTKLSGEHFEDSLYKQLGNYSIVHLATHGFYFKAEDATKYYSTHFSKTAIEKEPLFRSGLAVSGANNPRSNDEYNTPGYIMGYELANTDLRNCYLITLSACETGLGDIRNNMGVDGLSRALKIGGAKNLLISLWSVPDEPTAVFMQHFYEFLLKTGNPSLSLRQTQLKMCKQYKATDWAAFILVE